MVWLAFLISYTIAALLYFGHDIVGLTSGPAKITIYQMVFVTVMLHALFIGWFSKHKEALPFAFLFVANLSFGWAAWKLAGGYSNAVVAHGILHILIAGAFISLTKSMAGALVCLLFVLNTIWAHIEWFNILPDRPSGAFTGFYYPDLISYTSMLAMVIYGLSCGDGGSRIRNWLNRPWGVYAHGFTSRGAELAHRDDRSPNYSRRHSDSFLDSS